MRVRTYGAALIALALVVLPALPATAQDTPAATYVSNRETVEVELSPTGKVKEALLFSQLVVQGKGKVQVTDPTSTSGLRNINGFADPETKDGKAVWNLDVDGSAERRTAADFDVRRLPIDVKVDYKLNGQPVSATGLLGKSGRVTVTYTVRNITGTPTALTFKDGFGNQKTETVNLVTPYVGIMKAELPKNWQRIRSDRADVAGDGHGGHLLNWSMVLFEPVGTLDHTFGFEADVKNAETPAAAIDVVPVPPQRKPELKFAEDSLEHGSKAASELTQGAEEIDANLVKLRDGAGELLAGLEKLFDGAQQLKAGLAGEAAPGAGKLADGLAEAKDGSGKLADGTRQLADGTGQLADGTGKLSAGVSAIKVGAGAIAAGLDTVVAGLEEVEGGLAKLNDDKGLPAAELGAKKLQAGIGQLVANIGSHDTKGPLRLGLDKVIAGTESLVAPGGLPAAKGGVDQVKAGLTDAKTGIANLKGAAAQQQQVLGGAKVALNCGGAVDPAILQACGLIDISLALNAGIDGGLTSLGTGTEQAIAGLAQVSAGLGNAIAGIGSAGSAGTLLNGLAQINGGLASVSAGLSTGDPAHPGLKEGIDQLVVGLTKAVARVGELQAGVSRKLVPGVEKLAAGADQLAGGAGKAASGAAELDAGANELDAGARKIDDGTHELDEGLGDAKDGSRELADGLDEAADGSGKIAAGLGEAKAGGGKVHGGAAELRSKGTSKIPPSGNKTATEAAMNHAKLVALDAKAANGALPYGAPEGAQGSAAYRFKLVSATNDGSANATRALVAIGLLGVASAVGVVLRRILPGL